MFTYGINGLTGDYFFPARPNAELLSQFAIGEPLLDVADLKLKLESQRPHLGLISGIDARDISKAGWAVIFPKSIRSDVYEALKPLLELRHTMAGGLYREAIYHLGQNKGDFLAQYG